MFLPIAFSCTDTVFSLLFFNASIAFYVSVKVVVVVLLVVVVVSVVVVIVMHSK